MTRLRDRGISILQWRPGALARHGRVTLGWMLLRSGAQAATVVLLARVLGATAYGQVIAILAIASLVVSFAGLGLSHIVLRNAARDPTHEAFYFGRARRLWAMTLAPCMVTAIAMASMLLPSNLPVAAACVAITAEIAAVSFTELAARHRQAQQDMHTFGAIQAGLPLLRFGTMIVLLPPMDVVSATTVLWAYAISGLAYTVFLYRRLRVTASSNDGDATETMSTTSGLPFSLAMFATKLQAEFNKPVLAQTSFTLAGNYNVAQRVVDMASLPLMALQEALWPRLYAQRDPMRQLRRTGLALIAVALLLSATLWLTAPLLPVILGESFSNTVDVLRWLAWLPFLQAFRALFNFHAIHQGHMRIIGWTYALGATVSVVGVTMLVPTLGIFGAVVVGYTAEIAMITALVISNTRN